MRYSRAELLQLPNYHLVFDENIVFEKDTYKKFPRIRDSRDINARGDGKYDPKTQRLYLNLHVTGYVTVGCDITSEDVELHIDTEADEILSFQKEEDVEIIQSNGDYIEILPLVFQMIMMEIPIKVVKEGPIEYPSGDGWKVMDEKTYEMEKQNRIDPRLAILKNFKPQDEGEV